jgi:ketosteroid isomerase-like protein
MRAPTVLLTILLAIGPIACASQSGEPFDQADREAITKFIADFVVVYNAKDSAKVAQHFVDNGAVMPPNASTVTGTDSVRMYYDRRFAQGATDLKLETGDVVGAGSLAYATGNYWLNMAPPGGEVRRDRGKFIFILRERRGAWLLERLMFSSDFAPQASS